MITKQELALYSLFCFCFFYFLFCYTFLLFGSLVERECVDDDHAGVFVCLLMLFGSYLFPACFVVLFHCQAHLLRESVLRRRLPCRRGGAQNSHRPVVLS